MFKLYFNFYRYPYRLHAYLKFSFLYMLFTEHPQEKSVPNRQSLQHTILLTSSCILGSIFLVLTICAINRRSRETLLSERNKLTSRIVKWFYPASDRNLENWLAETNTNLIFLIYPLHVTYWPHITFLNPFHVTLCGILLYDVIQF